MAFSSSEIAGLTGGFNQQVMLQQQQAAMLTQQFGGYSPNPYMNPTANRGEQMSGMLMGTAANWGSQQMGNSSVAQPFQYAMGQMSYGVQQQQALDTNMRQAFRFSNTMGGRGFQGSETSQIGASLRTMSHERGAGGETASFEELGQLAANMGRMGMAEGVRSVKDFNEKFKTMLHTVKTIATELGTSLEEAQKVMSSLRGSGIFKNQGQFAGLLRQGALAGNMSISEMSSAAQMGAQISRSVGGLGKSGAYAGVKTLSNIGSAVQAGVMTEEDIYNTTGLTGAEGRQAMAQEMMSGDAQFFSGGIGRRMLASIAGKNGKVNESDAMKYMAGGVSTGETMSMAKHNLSGIGRANFIRNEGRLRGEAMNAFGGLAKAVAAKNWFESRGLNLNEEQDDRTMLGFQRIFKVGRDEADQLVKIVRNMDTIVEQKQESADTDRYARHRDQLNRKSSPEEIMKRLEMARTEINDGLREVGASFYKSISTTIDEYIGKMSGQYVQERRASMSKIVSKLMSGGPGTAEMLRKEFGVERDSAGNISTSSSSSFSAGAYREQMGTFGTGDLSGSQFNRYLGGNANRFREAGWDVTGAKSMSDVQDVVRRAQGLSYGFGSGTGTKDFQMDAETKAALQNTLAFKGIEGHGADFMGNFGKMLEGLGTEQAKSFAFKYSNRYNTAKTEEERGQIMRDMLEQAGPDVVGAYQDRVSAPGMLDARGGPFATVDTRNRDIGSAWQDNKKWKIGMDPRKTEGDVIKREWGKKYRELGSDTALSWGGEGTWGGWLANTGGAIAGGVADIGASATNALFGETKVDFGEQNKVVGEYALNEKTVGQTSTMLSGSSSERQALIQQLTQRDMILRGTEEGKRTPQENAELKVSRTQIALGRIQSGESREAVAKDLYNGDTSAMGTELDKLVGTTTGKQNADINQMMGEMGERARSDALANQDSEKAITSDIEKGTIQIGPAAANYRKQMQELHELEKQSNSHMSDEARNKLLGDIMHKHEEIDANFTGPSKTKAQREKDIADIAKIDPRKAMQLRSQMKDEERLAKSGNPRNRGDESGMESTMASILGVGDAKAADYKGLSQSGAVKKTLDSLGLGEGSNVDAAKRKEFEARLSTITKGFEIKGDGSTHVFSDSEKAQQLSALKKDIATVKADQEKKDKAKEYADSPEAKKLDELKTSIESIGKETPIQTTVKGVVTTTDKTPDAKPHDPKGNG